MAVNKTRPTEISVTTFVGALTEPARRSDAKAIIKMMKMATGEKAKDVGTFDHRIWVPPLQV